MDLGATLDEIIEAVQLEVGHSTSANVGVNFREHLAARIRNEYRRLHTDFEWPHLLGWHTIDTVVGTELCAFPADIALDRVSAVYAKLPDGDWAKLCRSLDVSDYNEVDTDADETRDPVLKWRPRGLTQFEIWPAPKTAGKLRIVAKSARLPLQDGDDLCDIDKDTLVLFAAASLLFKAGSEEAGVTLQRGRNRYDALRQRTQTGALRARL